MSDAPTPEELVAALAAIGWTKAELARRLDCSFGLVQRWATGVIAIPPPVMRWLGIVERAIARYPAPENWRPRPDMTLRQPAE